MKPFIYQHKSGCLTRLCVSLYIYLQKDSSVSGVAPDRSVTDMMPRLITPAEVTKIRNILSLFFTYTKSH